GGGSPGADPLPSACLGGQRQGSSFRWGGASLFDKPGRAEHADSGRRHDAGHSRHSHRGARPRLASMLDPSVRYLEQHGRSRIRAILTLYLLALSMFGIFLRFIVPPAFDQIVELGKNYPNYYTNVTKTADALLEKNHKTLQMLGIKQKRISELLNQS